VAVDCRFPFNLSRSLTKLLGTADEEEVSGDMKSKLEFYAPDFHLEKLPPWEPEQ
jgi:hypothetical protein